MGARNYEKNRTVNVGCCHRITGSTLAWTLHAYPCYTCNLCGCISSTAQLAAALRGCQTESQASTFFTYKLLKASALSISIAVEQTCTEHLCQKWVWYQLVSPSFGSKGTARSLTPGACQRQEGPCKGDPVCLAIPWPGTSIGWSQHPELLGSKK